MVEIAAGRDDELEAALPGFADGAGKLHLQLAALVRRTGVDQDRAIVSSYQVAVDGAHPVGHR